MALADGTVLGRYEIRAHLGTGGMGEVYLAHDTELERTVALKILPAEIATDQQRMQRFIQEAKTASGLNHPNIITIHEIVNEGNAHFIAMEYVEGMTLRQRITRTRLPLADALNIAIQIATALTAAHEKGIAHRDIKPENVMLRTDGFVKVLDFGLAKPTERQASSVDTEAQTRLLVNTSPGMVMGTANYMSPEQTRGYQLDARTDIWSLGVVLYEMLTAQVPFPGETTGDVIVSVLDREPPPLTSFLPDALPELQRILRKALRKDREERYQTVKDLLVDLRALKQDVEFEFQLERSTPPEARSGASYRTSSGGQSTFRSSDGAGRARTDEDLAARTGFMQRARNTDDAYYHSAEMKEKSKSRRLVTLSVLLLVIASGVSALAYVFIKHGPTFHRMTPFMTTKIARVTSTGKATNAAISPDGKYVAHVVSDGGQQSIWVKQLLTSSLLPIVPPTSAFLEALTFSRDGNYVYYLRQEDRSRPVYELYQVPVLGGASKRLIVDIDSPVTFSPDGKRIAFARGYPAKGESALIVANADGSNEKSLASRKDPARFQVPVWSPDGNVIACTTGNMADGVQYMNVVAVQVADGSEKNFTSQRWAFAGQLAWIDDGSGLVLSAQEQSANQGQVWYLSYPEGTARRITNDLNNYEDVSLTGDSNSLVTIKYEQLSNIWVSANRDRKDGRQVTSGAGGYYSFAWTADGHVVYTSKASGNRDIWMMNADGSNQKQLTFDDASDFMPTVTPDGRYIFFVSDRTGAPNIWRMNADGSNAKQATFGNNDSYPNCSPAGGWVYYSSWNSGQPYLRKVAVEGGNPVEITTKHVMRPVLSPDGKMIACIYWEADINKNVRIALLNAENGEIVKTLEMPLNLVRWTADGRALAYADERNGIGNVWIQTLDGRPPKQLTDFQMDKIFWFDWTRDGRQLACARGTVTSDVVLISDLKSPDGEG
ncbi:MAG: protein kinase [Pyrinomonadaceae bacterium]